MSRRIGIAVCRGFNENAACAGGSFIGKLSVLSAAYDVPILIYNISCQNIEQNSTIKGYCYSKGEFHTVETSLPEINDICIPVNLLRDDSQLSRKYNWITEHTKPVDIGGMPKERLSHLLIHSGFLPFAIPTYHIYDYQQLLKYVSLIPRPIIKPAGGRKGFGVFQLKKTDEGIYMVGAHDTMPLTEENWENYCKKLKENNMSGVLLQPCLDFSLDENHTVDFRLLVARGGSGDWETIAIYPRIGRTKIVSNLSQGGFVGDAREVLEIISPERSENLMAQLEKIAAELPPVVQNRCSPAAAFGIDVGIDRDTLQPYVLEINSKPGAKYYSWELAEKRVQYYRFLLNLSR